MSQETVGIFLVVRNAVSRRPDFEKPRERQRVCFVFGAPRMASGRRRSGWQARARGQLNLSWRQAHPLPVRDAPKSSCCSDAKQRHCDRPATPRPLHPTAAARFLMALTPGSQFLRDLEGGGRAGACLLTPPPQRYALIFLHFPSSSSPRSLRLAPCAAHLRPLVRIPVQPVRRAPPPKMTI